MISLLWVREVPLRHGFDEEVVVGDEAPPQAASPTGKALRSET